jgi:hypothetical protein
MTFTIGGKHRRPRLSAAFLALFALLASGCYKATGGGWLPSSPIVGADKAHFGFSVMCKTKQQNGTTVAILYGGQLEWHDGWVQFHARVEPFEFATLQGRSCRDLRETSVGILQFSGTYEPQPGGLSGNFVAVVVDSDRLSEEFTEFFNADSIQIELLGGQHAGYFNAGPVQQGSIQVF